MITTAQLSNKLTELSTEFRKVVDSGNAAEAFRWILETQEFLRDMLDEAESMKHLTAYEREVISEVCRANVLNQHNIKLQLNERIRKEATLK